MEDNMMPSMHLMPEWITRLLEDCGEEACNDKVWPLLLLQSEARAAVWGISTALGVLANGVPGQACRLLERYLAAQMRIYIRSTIQEVGPAWEGFKKSMSSRFPLLIVTCVQLAAKVNSADLNLSASVIRARLGCKGLVFTLSEIKRSEFHVYSMLEFRIPLWTSVEASEALAVEAGLPPAILAAVALFVDIAEYRRDVIDRRVLWAANREPSCSKYRNGTLRTLHLVAGSVLASARYVSFGGPDPAPRLAALTCVPVNYIRCISDSILSNLPGQQTSDSSPTKRKIGTLHAIDSASCSCKRKRQ